MRFIHLADLHLGKRINEFSMIEDQRYILNQILNMIDDIKADAVIVAGDVFDKTIPSEEAIRLFDHWLTALSKRQLPVFIVSGNHDSSQRIAFGSSIMSKDGIYISPVYNGNVESVILNDEYGDIAIWLLPFIKPVDVRCIFKDADIQSYTDAVRFAIGKMDIDPSKRNVIIAHQFVTDQEDASLGGIDNVDADVFDGFDYTALGHIHRPYSIGRETVRYGGSPLKYSFNEINQTKYVTVADVQEKGNIVLSYLPLKPLHDMREIRGAYLELTSKTFYEGSNTDDYIHAVLTDEQDVIDAIGKLRIIYPNILSLGYDNKRTQSSEHFSVAEGAEEKTPLDMFRQLYTVQNNQDLSTDQLDFCREIMSKIWEENA